MRVSYWTLIGAVICASMMAVGIVGKVQDKPLKTDSLAFMAGSWERSEGSAKMEEHWTAPLAGCMMGMFRQVAGDRKLREFEVIEETPAGVMMTIKHFTPDLKEIEGRVLVRKLIRSTANEAVFESTGDEPKQKLTYKREGNTLDARIELMRNGKPVTLDIPFTRMTAR